MFQSIKGIADDQKQTPEEFVKERIDRALQERTVGDDYYKRWLSLTKREKKVVELICLNYNNKEIAAELQIAEPTVKSHITRILGKVGLSNRHELRLVMSSFDFWDLDS
jgi:DNA-binding CsgD family transcriptional regulator